jgi:hypothetical protein
MSRRRRALSCFVAVALAGCAAARADGSSRSAALLALNDIFADHAVLQRDKPVPVWDSAAPGAAVTVSLGEVRASATADASGRWRVAQIEGTSVLVEASPTRPAGLVRCCWADSPFCNLHNAAGLPALPFELTVE